MFKKNKEKDIFDFSPEVKNETFDSVTIEPSVSTTVISTIEGKADFDRDKISDAVDFLLDYFTSPTNSFLNKWNSEEHTNAGLEKDVTDKLYDYDPEIIKDEKLTKEIVSSFINQLYGYGKIEPLLNDDDISDIKIHNHSRIRIKRDGHRETSNISFDNKKEYLKFVSLIATKNGINLGNRNAIKTFTDNSNPTAILRFNITTEFINSSKEPVVHIRKTLKNKRTLNDLKEKGMLTEEEKQYLIDKIKTSRGILFVGKGSAGKTTLMNACIEYIPHDCAGAVIQESEELFNTSHPDLTFQHLIENKGEGSIQYTLKDLTINNLLTDVDYVIISEIKGGEAAYFLNASYTGYKCWASVHGVNSTEALNKLCDYAMYETRYSRTEILNMLKYMEVIVFLEDYKIKEITEVIGFDNEINDLVYEPIFKNGAHVTGNH